MIDLKKLRELAEKALPGPWAVGEWGDGSNTSGCSNVLAPDSEIVIVKDIPYCDSSFIAALNPSTVLSLLDTIERYEGVLRGVVDNFDEPECAYSRAMCKTHGGTADDCMDSIKTLILRRAREALNPKEGET